jgi:hypothetical protein
VSGGTLGSYPLKPGKREAGPSGVEKAIKKIFPGIEQTVPGALPEGVTLTPAANGQAGAYTLHVPATAGKPAMDVPVMTVSLPNATYQAIRAARPHGGDTGPAMFIMEPGKDGSPPRARILINEDMRNSDLPRVLQHEFEELAFIASLRPQNAEDIKAQTEARLFQPDGTKAVTGMLPAHDRAQALQLARELAAATPAMKQFSKQQGKDGFYCLEANIEARLNELGFNNAAHLERKLAELEKSFDALGLKNSDTALILNRIRTLALQSELTGQLRTGNTLVVGQDLISHAANAQYRQSKTSPLSGGHWDSVAQKYADRARARSEGGVFLLEIPGTRRQSGSQVYKAYEQWKWEGNTDPADPAGKRKLPPDIDPPDSAQSQAAVRSAPAGAEPEFGQPGGNGKWVRAGDPKTTVSDIVAFMREAQDAYDNSPDAQRLSGAVTSGKGEEWDGRASPRGVLIGGITFNPSGTAPDVRTVYPKYDFRNGWL